MSALTGALAVGLGLVAEEVLVTSRGGSGAVSGAFGTVAKVIDHLADPSVPAIPDLADRKPKPKPTPNVPTGAPGQNGPADKELS
jgi:hypothetical protein